MITFEENLEITGDYEKAHAVTCKNGTYVGQEKNGILSFKGIPFAKPPVGGLRWKEPAEAEAREGVYEAYYFARVPLQKREETEAASMYEQGEDCLYLNIWTDQSTLPEKKPVMVYIHGGGFCAGGTVAPLFEGQNFAEAHRDVVFVTIAYRLGVMGFVDFSEVEGGEEFQTSGNLGLLDQIMALRYIKENIEGFGGDPSCITVFGESAGAGSISHLLLIPQAKGLFQRAIAQSGSVALSYSRQECQKLTNELLKESGAGNMKELMALSEKDLFEMIGKLQSFANLPERDGVILSEDLYDCYEKGIASEVDLLIGTNADEVRFWIQMVGGLNKYRYLTRVLFENNIKILSAKDKENLKQFLQLRKSGKNPEAHTWSITEFYSEVMFRLPAIRQAEAHARNGGKTYMYCFTYPSAIPHLRACHATDVSYVLNNLDVTIYTGERGNERLAELMQQMWVNFAKTGDPSTEEITWEPYHEDTRKTMLIGNKTYMKEHYKDGQRALLTPLLDYHFNGCYANLSAKVPIVYKTVAAGAGVLALTAGGIIAAVLKGRKK